MLKSLYAGVSGMKSQQTKMDVIANNIANVSTTGFKSGRVRFEDMISQIDAAAQGANNNRGGVNAQQVGMGVQVSGTDTIMTGGSLQATGRGLDFGIQNGDNSFFIVSGSGDGNNAMQYTRDGGFYTDEDGNLVTSSGMRVMGYTPANGLDLIDGNEGELGTGNLSELVIHETYTLTDEDGNETTITLQSFNIDDTGNIIGTYDDGQTYLLGRVGLANFTNPDGLEKQGGNLYNQTANSGIAQIGAPSDEGFGVIRSGFLEMSNVDLANEFTDMIVTSRAYQANSRAITTSDEMLQELLNLKR
ncbi:flagellar hook-basal body complex protein [Carnobacteriaceae bacterium 52-44]